MFNLGEMNFGRYNIYRHLNNGVIKNKPFFQKSFFKLYKNLFKCHYINGHYYQISIKFDKIRLIW